MLNRPLRHPDGTDPAYYLEETGDVLILAASYIKASSNKTIATQYYSTFKGWADYLSTNSLFPALQASTDDFQGSLANQTNLAIKGIVGLRAMADISTAAGNTADASNYTVRILRRMYH